MAPKSKAKFRRSGTDIQRRKQKSETKRSAIIENSTPFHSNAMRMGTSIRNSPAVVTVWRSIHMKRKIAVRRQVAVFEMVSLLTGGIPFPVSAPDDDAILKFDRVFK